MVKRNDLPNSWKKLESAIWQLGFDAQIEIDNQGQLLIYTGLMQDPKDETGDRLIELEIEPLYEASGAPIK